MENKLKLMVCPVSGNTKKHVRRKLDGELGMSLVIFHVTIKLVENFLHFAQTLVRKTNKSVKNHLATSCAGPS